MSTLQPREPYTDSELKDLYPDRLELSLVQIILRHGERAPTSVRLQSAGLSRYWPYCNAARRLRSVALTSDDASAWNVLQWRRRLETFGDADDRPMIASAPSGEIDGLCQGGELTDLGRHSTYELGKRLRHLYVHQLGFMPKLLSNADMFYLRSTEVLRAIESTQQTWLGMYPNNTKTAPFSPPTIITRPLTEETLFPNEFHCQKFIHLFKEFDKFAAKKWNDSIEMNYLNEHLSEWMPPDSPRISVDSQPSLHGIMDTIFATQAHGPNTRLPEVFYHPKILGIINKIACDEYYGAYSVNRDIRMLGTGAFAGDVVDRMIIDMEKNSSGLNIASNAQLKSQRHSPGPDIRFALYGCHDVTLAAFLASFGTFENPSWPQFTSHIAVELFRRKELRQSTSRVTISSSDIGLNTSNAQPSQFNPSLHTSSPPVLPNSSSLPDAATFESTDMIRRAWSDYSKAEKEKLDGYYVRLRYNDRILRVPGCAPAGRHLEGDDSFCTLEAFKRIADGFIPKNWKNQCAQKLEGPIAGIEKNTEQRSGYIEEGF